MILMQSSAYIDSYHECSYSNWKNVSLYMEGKSIGVSRWMVVIVQSVIQHRINLYSLLFPNCQQGFGPQSDNVFILRSEIKSEIQQTVVHLHRSFSSSCSFLELSG